MIKNWTDSNGVVWGSKADRDGRLHGKPFKVLDPHYVPDNSPRITDDSNLRGALGVTLLVVAGAIGGLLGSLIFDVAL